MRELVENTPPRPPWTWDGYLTPGHITLLAGDAKAGKSTLVYGLLGALENGSTFAGRPTRKTKAAVISEEGRDTIREKLQRFGGGTHLVVAPEHLYLKEWGALIEQVTDLAIENGCGLLVVDTFANLAQLRDDEENSAGAVIAKLAPLLRAAHKGLAVLLIHHTRKSGGANGVGVRGSGALTARASIVIQLSRIGTKGAKRQLDGIGHFQDTPETWKVELTDSKYVALSNESAAQRNHSLYLAALDALGSASDEQVHAHLSASGVGLSTSTVTRTRKDAMTNGHAMHVEGTSNPKLYKRVNG
jgi:hypothetical protein